MILFNHHKTINQTKEANSSSNYSTTDTYKIKWESIDFSIIFSSQLTLEEVKFTANMICRIVASKSCFLIQINQWLQKNTKKRYTVDRLSNYFDGGIPEKAQEDCPRYVQSTTPVDLAIHIDGSDVVKSEALYSARAQR